MNLVAIVTLMVLSTVGVKALGNGETHGTGFGGELCHHDRVEVWHPKTGPTSADDAAVKRAMRRDVLDPMIEEMKRLMIEAPR
jgi:hypothetical protein